MAKSTKNVETIVDEAGVEILVSYNWSKEYDEAEHEDNFCALPIIYTELNSVEIVIKGKGIDILPMMSEKQKAAIIEQLNYD